MSPSFFYLYGHDWGSSGGYNPFLVVTLDFSQVYGHDWGSSGGYNSSIVVLFDKRDLSLLI